MSKDKVVKAKPVKVAKEKTVKKSSSENEEIIISGHDPKNKEVVLRKTKGGYVVEKPLTAFTSEVISDLKEAEKLYEEKLHCSQNF